MIGRNVVNSISVSKILMIAGLVLNMLYLTTAEASISETIEYSNEFTNELFEVPAGFSITIDLSMVITGTIKVTGPGGYVWTESVSGPGSFTYTKTLGSAGTYTVTEDYELEFIGTVAGFLGALIEPKTQTYSASATPWTFVAPEDGMTGNLEVSSDFGNIAITEHSDSVSVDISGLSINVTTTQPVAVGDTIAAKASAQVTVDTAMTFSGAPPVDGGGRSLVIPEVMGSPGEQITVPINIDDATNVAGADIEITYDSSVLALVEVRTTTLSSELNMVANTNTPGKIIMGMAGMGIESGSGAFIDMIFTLDAGAATGTETSISFASADVYDINGLNLPIETQDGKVAVVKAVSTVSSIIKLVTEPLQPAGSDFWVTVQVGDESSPVENFFGISFKLSYTNTGIIDALEVAAGDFLGTGIVFFPDIEDASGVVSVGASMKSGSVGVNGYGDVAKVRMRFAGSASPGGSSVLTLLDIKANDPDGNSIQLTPQGAAVEVGGILVWPGDTDNNGQVDGLDVFPIGRYWHSTGPARESASSQWVGQKATAWSPEAATYADANGDGIVDEGDVLEIGLNWRKTHGDALSAPPMLVADMNHAPYLRQYVELLRALESLPAEEPVVKMREILRKAISLSKRESIPEKTAVLQNYPNPFNPETWIPFNLAAEAEVKITIYNAAGLSVRTLDLGYLKAGTYTSKNAAAYWDGRNENWEQVSSGVYFYTIQAGDFTATRKMVVAK